MIPNAHCLSDIIYLLTFTFKFCRLEIRIRAATETDQRPNCACEAEYVR